MSSKASGCLEKLYLRSPMPDIGSPHTTNGRFASPRLLFRRRRGIGNLRASAAQKDTRHIGAEPVLQLPERGRKVFLHG
jgi:hypothetical protein